MPQITSVMPELPSGDLNRTRAFYETKLGFRTVSQYDDYIIFTRDSVRIHYFLYADLDPLANYGSCYLYVDDAQGLYAEYAAQGVIHPNGALKDQPYGVREFVVVDDNNCLLKFGQVLTASQE